MTDFQMIALRAAQRGEHPGRALEKAIAGRREAQRIATRTVTQLINRGFLVRPPGDWFNPKLTDAGREALAWRLP